MTASIDTGPKNIFLVLSTPNPDGSLVEYLEKLLESSKCRLLIINDGHPKEEFEQIFSPLIGHKNFEFLHHAIPMGEDQALKTGINHLLIHPTPASTGIITFNPDDRYPAADIHKVITALEENPETFCLGVHRKKFTRFTRPWLGNKIAKYAFRFTTGYAFSDFQSSLIGIPTRYFRLLLQEDGNGAKVDLLVQTTRNRQPILEVPVEYLNETLARFNPLRDSIKISFVFLRFILLSFSTALIDNIIFFLAHQMTGSILASLLIARLVAGTYNFTLASRWVFRSPRMHSVRRAVKFAFLVLVLMFVSYGLLTPMVAYIGFDPYLSKIIAEGIIFLLSFAAQALFVFSPEKAISQRTAGNKNPFFASPLVRRLMEHNLLRIVEKYHPEPVDKICELGGADSDLFTALARKHPHASYTIIDKDSNSWDADIVFSAGWIEQFCRADVSQAIRAHFACTRPGAVVILFFSTPSALYRALTRIAGWFRDRHSHPEPLLTMNEVIREGQQYGKVACSAANQWGILPLAVLVVIV